MTETATNRSWVITNRMPRAAVQASRPAESVETLLYYQTQLEAELEEVRRRIADVIRGQ